MSSTSYVTHRARPSKSERKKKPRPTSLTLADLAVIKVSGKLSTGLVYLIIGRMNFELFKSSTQTANNYHCLSKLLVYCWNEFRLLV